MITFPVKITFDKHKSVYFAHKWSILQMLLIIFFFLLVNLAELSVFYFYLGQCMEVFFFDRQLNALIFE